MLVNPPNDGSVRATVVSYQRDIGIGVAKCSDGEKVEVTKNALVCEDDKNRFLVEGHEILCKKIEISPGKFMAVQVRNSDDEPITHKWQQGLVKSFHSSGSGVIAVFNSTQEKTFSKKAVIGCPNHVRRAHCMFVASGGTAVAILGLDMKPFPQNAADVVKPLSARVSAIKNKKPGELFSSRYEVIQEAQEDHEGWRLGAIYKGKILFYHKAKGYGFITPLECDDSQDPANLFFSRQQVLIKRDARDPLFKGKELVRFQVGINPGKKQSGKPCAMMIMNVDGSLVDADLETHMVGVKRPLPFNIRPARQMPPPVPRRRVMPHQAVPRLPPRQPHRGRMMGYGPSFM